METPMLEPDIAAYARHSRWSDPGSLGSHLDRLSADPVALPEIVGGLVLHPFFAPTRPASAASLRRVADLLNAVLEHDNRPLDEAREPANRLIGTCRSYAILACAILRQHAIPARLRIGFANYFEPGHWEDHWVCEYHDGTVWRLLDAELSADVREQFGIAFDPADLPRQQFLAAGMAWQALRRGEYDPARFGVSFLGLAGEWFVAGSVLRDLAALSMNEMMPWDSWGPGRDFLPGKDISPDWLNRLDSLAAALATEHDPASIVAAHPWAALTPSILSFPEGRPVEVLLADA
jgi:Transglutaminase-like superfamily